MTVVIVTRNRRDEALRAVTSALHQEGCTIEVIVVDGASTDGTAEFLSEQSPDAWIYQADADHGPNARRNFAASIARGEFLVGIDDDAELTDRSTLAMTLRDFDAGDDIGAVAIPCWETGPDGAWSRLYPEATERIEVIELYVGCGYAIRRELFLLIGGYESNLFYFGEERDLATRLLQAGYFVRIGTAPAVLHRPSPLRRSAHKAFLARRNDVLFAWQRVPSHAMLFHLLRTTAGGLLAAVRAERGHYIPSMLRGMVRGWREARHTPRAPVSPAVYKLGLRLRRKGPMPLAEARVRLHDLGA